MRSADLNDEQFHSAGISWHDMLLFHPAALPQYLIEVSDGMWECPCGNRSEFEGFLPCDTDGQLVQAVLGHWDGAMYVCERCGRIFSSDTMEVLGTASNRVMEENHPQSSSYF